MLPEGNKNSTPQCFISEVSFFISRARARGGEVAVFPGNGAVEARDVAFFFFNSSMCFSKISSFPPHTLILESDQSQATVLCFCWENTIFIRDAEARLCKPLIASEKQICFRLDRNHVTKFISCWNLFA